MKKSRPRSAPKMLFIAARRGIGAGALAAACAARVAQGGRKTVLADLRNRPHPSIAQNNNAKAPPFRLPKSGGECEFADNEIAIALADSSDSPDSAKSDIAAIIFTYAECDLAAARLAAERLRKAGANFACVAVHTPSHFPFLPQLRNRAAKALGNARVIEAPAFPPDKLVADSLAGQPCEDPALAHAINKLAKLADPNSSEDEADDSPTPNLPKGVNLGDAVAAVRREMADVV